jgi:hypothetical protein
MMTRAPFRTAFLALTFALAAHPAHADEAQVSDAARAHFKTGVAYLTDPDGARYEEAYAEFKIAYADSPSWKILGNLGISSMKLERDAEAVDAFEKYLAGGGQQIDPAERAQMERDLMTTKSGLVWVTIQVNPPGAVAVLDERQPLTGRSISNRYETAPDGTLRVGVRRGRHKFTAKLDGYVDGVWEFEGAPGPELTHDFKLEKPVEAPAAAAQPAGAAPAPVMKRPITTPVIIGAAATGALLAGSAVVGVIAMGKKSKFNGQNDGLHVDEAQSLRDSAASMNLVGNVLLGGAVVAGAVTTFLFIKRPEVPASGDPGQGGGARARRIEVLPAVGATGGGFVMSGQF